MAQITIASKVAAALIAGGSMLGVGVLSGAIAVPGMGFQQPVETESQVSADAVDLQSAPDDSAWTDVPPVNEADMSASPLPLIIPSFGLLRVEPNGSVVIAGNAAPNANVEAITGNRALGSATAEANGDFVIIFDSELPPGDYEIVLRADNESGTAATSLQTAVVSIPEGDAGGVLALVEQPGAPSRLISVGQGTAKPLEAVAPQTITQQEVAVAEPQAKIELETQQRPQQLMLTDAVRIEAVEIDGKTVFVAGRAEPASRLRVYANDILLGETIANPDGSFLVQVNRDLPVGDYLVRADLLSANGAEVVVRAAVPFARQPGEKLAAIAVQRSVELPVTAPSIENVAPGEAVVQRSANAVESVGAQAKDLKAEGVETQLQPPLAPVDDSVIIRRGDTLWQISRRVYGLGVKYTTIYNANADQIRDPNRIWPGQIFSVPQNVDQDKADNAPHKAK